jgi:hypothetical protein
VVDKVAALVAEVEVDPARGPLAWQLHARLGRTVAALMAAVPGLFGAEAAAGRLPARLPALLGHECYGARLAGAALMPAYCALRPDADSAVMEVRRRRLPPWPFCLAS